MRLQGLDFQLRGTPGVVPSITCDITESGRWLLPRAGSAFKLWSLLGATYRWVIDSAGLRGVPGRFGSLPRSERMGLGPRRLFVLLLPAQGTGMPASLRCPSPSCPVALCKQMGYRPVPAPLAGRSGSRLPGPGACTLDPAAPAHHHTTCYSSFAYTRPASRGRFPHPASPTAL